jgi:hypothetical protein
MAGHRWSADILLRATEGAAATMTRPHSMAE